MKRYQTGLVSRFIIVAAVAVFAATTVEAAGFKVVVNQSNSTTTLSKTDMSAIYLKRQTRWPAGGKIEMVDQKEKSEARDAFLADVLGRDAIWVNNHWQRIVFTGRGAPPRTMKSESEVLDFVRSQAGGIGFVAEDTPLGGGLRVVTITD
jgi:ABC-type phosphate transport system substrate-binding protein